MLQAALYQAPPRSTLYSPGNMASYNVNDGFLEGIVRGYSLGLLTRIDYGNLTQCDSLDGPSSLHLLLSLSLLSLRCEDPPEQHRLR